MKKMKRLPEAEFEVMRAVWALEPPMSVKQIIEVMGPEKKWVEQAVIMLLMRLAGRGFVKTEKNGRNRVYYPLAKREEYLEFETENFIKQYHGSSFANLVSTLYKNKNLTEKDVDELSEWFEERKK
jgi:predicted transcriptional regulator